MFRGSSALICTVCRASAKPQLNFMIGQCWRIGFKSPNFRFFLTSSLLFCAILYIYIYISYLVTYFNRDLWVLLYLIYRKRCGVRCIWEMIFLGGNFVFLGELRSSLYTKNLKNLKNLNPKAQKLKKTLPIKPRCMSTMWFVVCLILNSRDVAKPHFMQVIARIPLLRFVVELLCNFLYNKSTTNRSNGVCAYGVGRPWVLTQCENSEDQCWSSRYILELIQDPEKRPFSLFLSLTTCTQCRHDNETSSR